MLFEWDKAKDAANIAKHGVSFAMARRIFDGPVLTRIDDRQDYGEVREYSLGVVGGVLILVVIHTRRMERIRIISARRANRTERKAYEEAIRKGADPG